MARKEVKVEAPVEAPVELKSLEAPAEAPVAPPAVLDELGDDLDGDLRDGEPDLLEAVEYTEKAAKGERVLDQHRLAFEIHKERLKAESPGKAIQFLPQTRAINHLRFKVGQGEALSDGETWKVFQELKEFIADKEFIFAASAVDILLASDKIERQG